MADSDFTIRGGGTYAAVATLTLAVSYLTERLYLGNKRENGTPQVVNDVVMVDDEFMAITAIGANYIEVKRGIFDTIPEPHEVGAAIWFVKNAIATDNLKYAAGETLAVKILPYTANGGQVALAAAPARGITFNSRFWRPYPPADFKINGDPWFENALSIDTASPTDELIFTWAHRDRLLQADVRVGHTEASIGPEEDQQYFFRGFRGDDTNREFPIFTSAPITAATFTYTVADLVTAFSLDDIPADAVVLEFFSERDTYESYYRYLVNLAVL